MPPGIIDSITEHGKDPPATGTLPCVTNARWFFFELSKETLGTMFTDNALWDSSNKVKLELAWHGTALHNLLAILLGGLEKGPNTVADSRGRITAKVDCE